MRKPKPRNNPLLSEPPHAFHRATGGPAHRYGPSHYMGVHTTTCMNRAAGYARGACRALEGWLVALVLDVAGLDPMPDVDALEDWRMLDTNGALEILTDVGMSLEDANERWLEGDETYEQPIMPGDDPIIHSFAQGVGNPFRAALDAFSDEEEALSNLVYALDENAWEQAFPGAEYPMGEDRLKAYMIPQRRYLRDIQVGRLVRVEVIRPWYPRALDPGDGNETNHGESAGEMAEAAGLQTVALEDLDYWNVQTKTVWSSGRRGRVEEYHGTSSELLPEIFEELGEEVYAAIRDSGFPSFPMATTATQAVENEIFRRNFVT